VAVCNVSKHAGLFTTVCPLHKVVLTHLTILPLPADEQLITSSL